MKKHFIILLAAISLGACKDSKNKAPKETITTGVTTLWVDESVAPLSEDLVQVFERYYDRAKIEIKTNHATAISNKLLKNEVNLAILSRELNNKEIEHLAHRTPPIITPIANEPILFITNKNSTDSLLIFKDFLNQLNNSEKVIVFDNANSTIVKKIQEESKIELVNKKNIYFMQNTKEVIDYIAKNNKAIGIVGSNWMYYLQDKNNQNISTLRTMKVWSENEKQYIKPTQSTIADKSYPLVRTINIINTQGNAGLGKGLASFVAGDKGQRIVLKSGMMPIAIPPREIIVK